jgi:hypothetical protein
VEIVGGATRIPRVKQLAKEFFAREQLDMSLNGDEACALGAALFAAKMSTSFRLREFLINDLYPHDLAVKLSGGAQFDAEEGEPGGKASKEKLLFAKGARFPRKKVLTLSRDSDFAIDALVNGEPMASLEISGLAAGLATVKTAKREPVGKPKTSVTFALSASGLLEIAKAELMLDVLETYDEYVQVPVKEEEAAATKDTEPAAKEAEPAAKEAEPAADADAPSADADSAAAADGGADGDADGGAADGGDDAGAAADGEGKEDGEPKADGEADGKEADGADGADGGAGKADADADAAGGKKGGKADASKAKAGGKGKKEKKKPPATRKEKVTKTAKRVHHVALKAAATYTTPVPVIGAAVIADCIARNQRMLDAEDVRRVDAEAKNRLEAYILCTRDRLADHEERVALISTDEQRAELAKRFEEVRASARGESDRERERERNCTQSARDGQAGRDGADETARTGRPACGARVPRGVPAALARPARQLCSHLRSPPCPLLPRVRVALLCCCALLCLRVPLRAQVEEWLYEDGRAVTGDVYTAKADSLRALGEPVFERLAEVRAQGTNRSSRSRPRRRRAAAARALARVRRAAAAAAARAHPAQPRRAPPRPRLAPASPPCARAA